MKREAKLQKKALASKKSKEVSKNTEVNDDEGWNGIDDSEPQDQSHQSEDFKRPEGKMSSKKKKRLDQYIKKKLAKEEKATLMQQLSTTSFSSELMLSSKALGQTSMTTKQKLRYALNQQKAGIPISDPNVRLLVEKEAPDEVLMPVLTKGTGVQGKVSGSLIGGSALKPGTNLADLPLKSKTKKLVSVRELLKRPKDASESDSFDSSASESDEDDDDQEENEDTLEDEVENVVPTKVKDVEANPTTSLTYLQGSEQVKKKVEQPINPYRTSLTTLTTTADSKKAYYVHVKRPQEIQEARLKLPILSEEQPIMEAIEANDCVIICGETGSGKTTQLPQFLYEAGYGDPNCPSKSGLIGITQPRRVAAVSTAARVATELNTTNHVAHQIRYESNLNKDTRIKFMTDGVLLREVANDLLLTKYSALLLDEAHERTLNTDILIGVLSRALRLRNQMVKEGKKDVKPLKLVIMSATLRVEDFINNSRLFPDPDKIPPVIKVGARQFPVTVHFNKKTPQHFYEHANEAYRKIVKIHTRLPPGGILVFLTGQQEIKDMCRKLKSKFPSPKVEAVSEESKSRNKPSKKKLKNTKVIKDNNKELETKDDQMLPDVALEPEDVEALEQVDNPTIDYEFDDGNEDYDFGDSEEELDDPSAEHLELSDEITDQPLYVLPLYSMLPSDRQLQVFQPPPAGHRLCVVATNVAETSITIPGIRYVVDVGLAKEKKYDPKSEVSKFEIDFISKASAEQRAGRAGRTGPGHCYRLYSSAVFNDTFQPYAKPEIFRTPIDGVVLQMKAMNLTKLAKFPFPTPPPVFAIQKAERTLTYLGALNEGHITEIGKLMAQFPVPPRLAKMLVVGQQFGCMPYTVALVATLTVGDIFFKDHQLDEADDDENLDEDGIDSAKSQRRRFYDVLAKFNPGDENASDLLRDLNAIGAYEYSGATHTFITQHFLRAKALEEIRKLRRQLTHLIQLHCPKVDIDLNPKLLPPTPTQLVALRQIVLAGFVDQVAVLKSHITKFEEEKTYNKGIRATPKYVTMWSDQEIFIEPASTLYLKNPPQPFVAYSNIHITNSGTPLMRGVTAIEPKWLTNIAKPLITFSKPLNEKQQLKKLQNAIKNRKFNKIEENADAEVMCIPRFGPKSWDLPVTKVKLNLLK